MIITDATDDPKTLKRFDERAPTKREIEAFCGVIERGAKLRDRTTQRIGSYTGEQQTMSPPNFGVIWDDDATAGWIRFVDAEIVAVQRPVVVDLPTKDAHVPPILRERHSPQLDITSMSQPELQNIMGSMQAMAAAQLRRFDAAGVLVLVFDKGGTALQVFERPEHDAITDDYARAAVAQLVGIETRRERKGRRK